MATIPDEVLFRYQVVSQVLALRRSGSSATDAVRAVARLEHVAWTGRPRRLSERTLWRWLRAFSQGGIAALAPEPSRRVEGSLVLSQDFLDFLEQEKRDDPATSVPELIRRAREDGLLEDTDSIDRTTVYRACQRLGLPVGKIKKRREARDSRRFAYPHRMDMVLCDGKHFRAGASRAKRVALHFIDDATRLALHVVVGTSETTRLFLRGLYELVCKYGRMDILYLDKGPGFIANDTALVVAHLPALLLHGETAYPAGHGKVERFHQTTDNDVLRGWDHRPDIDPDCRALELRLLHYEQEIYNHQPHQSLGEQTPYRRFQTDEKSLCFPSSDQELRNKFEVTLGRRVTPDHVISIDSILYEMPIGYAGQEVDVRRKILEGTVHFLHEGRLIRLHPVDLEANARSRRARGVSNHQTDIDRPRPRSAADRAFEREWRPVVDPDGGFQDPHHP